MKLQTYCYHASLIINLNLNSGVESVNGPKSYENLLITRTIQANPPLSFRSDLLFHQEDSQCS